MPLMEKAGPMDWTEDRLEELKRLWVDETRTSSQIAERMEITRGMVLGKINRLGLLRHLAEPTSSKLSVDAGMPQGQGEPVASQALPPLPAAPSSADFEGMESHASSEIGKHPTIFELRAGQCRFPLGGPREPARFFCGKPADAPRPYCRECSQRAYTAMKSRM